MIKRLIKRASLIGLLVALYYLRIEIGAQTIGFHPNLQLGFNPYLSPVFGYGLGLPYGAYGLSPMRNPWFSKTILGATFGPGYHLKHLAGFSGVPLGSSLSGKLHSSKFLKKLAGYEEAKPDHFGMPTNFKYFHHGLQPSIKDKLVMMKHQFSLSTPYNYDYGYKRHYGAKVIY